MVQIDESPNGAFEPLLVHELDGLEVVVRRIELGKGGEKVASDDVGDGRGVRVFVEDDLFVERVGWRG
jgi:hypothetical protein